MSAMNDNGVITATITRPLQAPNDDDLSLDDCRYLIIGSGGGVSANGATFSRHESTPVISEEKICLTASQLEGNDDNTQSGSFIAANLAFILSCVIAAILH